jgi:putative spermidine/putrescine transport system ATP-binding protein
MLAETMSSTSSFTGSSHAASSEDSIAVDIIGMDKWYGEFHVLREINLRVMRGERIVVAGPSGSGKSTMIRCINQLEEHQKGKIIVDGIELTNDVKRVHEVRREVGMVFQHFNLFPHLTILENCALALIWVRKMPRKQAEEIAMHFLERVKIPDQAHKYPGQLSGGQQQRVAIARAIVIEPPLVLMDEPLSNLDTKLRIEMRAEIRRIHSQLERATIYVTHDQDEALSMADRIVVMKEGVVQQVATPKEVYGRPSNLHVARFMGYRNVIEFALEGMQGEAVAVSNNGVRLLGMPMHGFNSKHVSVALRPEDMERSTPGVENTFDADVLTVEYGGRDSLIRVKTAFGNLWARVAGDFSEGERINLRVPPSRALVYGGETA